MRFVLVHWKHGMKDLRNPGEWKFSDGGMRDAWCYGLCKVGDDVSLFAKDEWLTQVPVHFKNVRCKPVMGVAGIFVLLEDA